MTTSTLDHFPKASVLKTETFIPRPLDEVFEFFSNAENLETLTPKTLGFTILTPTPIPMTTGTLIDYRIRIHGIPVKWKTEILLWDPPRQFIDMQLKGPYRLWHHLHTFKEVEGGVQMTDIVHYVSPFHAIMDRLYIRNQVKEIFAYRTQRLHELFPPQGTDARSSM